jgi:hypothetical protein
MPDAAVRSAIDFDTTNANLSRQLGMSGNRIMLQGVMEGPRIDRPRASGTWRPPRRATGAYHDPTRLPSGHETKYLHIEFYNLGAISAQTMSIGSPSGRRLAEQSSCALKKFKRTTPRGQRLNQGFMAMSCLTAFPISPGSNGLAQALVSQHCGYHVARDAPERVSILTVWTTGNR